MSKYRSHAFRMKTLNHILCIYCVFLPLVLIAQENISVDFVAVSPDIAISDLYYQNGDQIVAFNVPTNRRSKKQHYRGPATANFFKITGAPEDPKAKRIPVAQVAFDQSQEFPLLIFLPKNGTGKEAYKVTAIEDSYKKIPGQSMRFVNLTANPLGLLLGEEGKTRIPLRKGEVGNYVFPADTPNLRIRIAIFNEDTAEAGLDKRLFSNSEARTIYFIYKIRKGSPAVRLKSMRDTVKKAKSLQNPEPDKAS